MSGSIQPAGESPRGKGKPSRSKLDDAPCAPMDREKLARLIWNVLIDWHAETDAPAYSIADALLAAGLRLPGVKQPDETLAWAVVGEDGVPSLVSQDRVTAMHLGGPGERVVRAAIRIVEDEA